MVAPAGTVTSTPSNKGDAYPSGTVFSIDKSFTRSQGLHGGHRSEDRHRHGYRGACRQDGADEEVLQVPVVVTYRRTPVRLPINANAEFQLDTDGDGAGHQG